MRSFKEEVDGEVRSPENSNFNSGETPAISTVTPVLPMSVKNMHQRKKEQKKEWETKRKGKERKERKKRCMGGGAIFMEQIQSRRNFCGPSRKHNESSHRVKERKDSGPPHQRLLRHRSVLQMCLWGDHWWLWQGRFWGMMGKIFVEEWVEGKWRRGDRRNRQLFQNVCCKGKQRIWW